jgi:hypothetical protein
MYPVDLMKVYIASHPKPQTKQADRHLEQTRMQIINPSSGGLYTGLSHAVSTIYRLEGLRTLWRGMTSVIVGAGTTFWECIESI